MLETALAILPASLTSGLNLYLTVLGLGVASRLNYLQLPDGLSYIESWFVISVAGILFLIEFFADKIPYVDSLWDFLHTFVRPAGALVLALGAIPPEQAEMGIAVGLLAGGTALTAHSGKASFRALVNTSPEPVSNSVVSLAEDGLVVAVLLLAIRYPIAAGIMAGVVAVLLLVVTVLILRWAMRAFGSLRAFFRRRKPQPVG